MLKFIYSIQCDSENFTTNVLKNLSSVFSFEHVTFLLADSNEQYMNIIGNNISEQSIKKYNSYYYKTDIFLPQNHADESHFMPRNVATNTDVMSLSNFENTEFYQDFLKHENFYYEAALYLRKNNRFIGAMGVFRDRCSGRFTKKELTILDMLNPFISSGFYNDQKFCRIQREQQLYEKCVAQIPLGIIVLDNHFSVIVHNRIALECCRDIQKGKKMTDDPVKDTVRMAVSHLQVHEDFSLLKSSSKNYQFHICPVIVPDGDNGIANYYVIYIQGFTPESYKSPASVSANFDLTEREKEIIGLIANGLSNKQIAAHLQISRNTVRTHVENILIKLSVTNRTAILSKIGIIKAYTSSEL